MSQSIQKIVALSAVLLLFAGLNTLQAQSYSDAVDTFNEAQELMRSDQNTAALEKFKETISIAEQVGSEADEIKSRAQSQLVRLQFAIAGNEYRARNFEDAITAFERTIELAEKYGESEFAQRSQNALPVVYLQKGNAHYRNEAFDRAEENYRKALDLNANYARAYYQLGLVERGRGNRDAAIEKYDRAITVAINVGDSDVERQAERAARDYLTYLGSLEIEEGRYRAAVELLNRSLEYDMEYASTFYRLAEAYNNMAMWDEAIENAQRALRFEDGGQVARAKIHFELGLAYKEKGNEAQACDHFRNAAYGQFRAAAEHELEHELSCNSSSRR